MQTDYPTFIRQRMDSLVKGYIRATVYGDQRKADRILDQLYVMQSHGNDTVSPAASEAIIRITKWELET